MAPTMQARGVARQLRVGVERDDVLHLRRGSDVSPTTREKRPVGRAAQQRVQVGQFPALALVSHPDAFLGVPAPRAVEEEERAAVLLVQLVDPLRGETLEGVVLGKGLLGGVRQVRQEAEADVVVPVAEEAHLQRFDQVLHVLRARDQRRDDDQGPRGRGDALRQVHLRQGVGRRQPGTRAFTRATATWLAQSSRRTPDQPEEPAVRAFAPHAQRSGPPRAAA